MKTIHMTKGLPGSGKSTWAKKFVELSNGAIKRVNKDDLRAMLDVGHWTKDNENFVLKVRDFIIDEALNAGKSIVVDDTNFAPKHEIDLREIARVHGANFTVVDFTHVSLEVCIERDLKRPHSVGETVIRQMYDRYLRHDPPIVERIPGVLAPLLPALLNSPGRLPNC